MGDARERQNLIGNDVVRRMCGIPGLDNFVRRSGHAVALLALVGVMIALRITDSPLPPPSSRA